MDIAMEVRNGNNVYCTHTVGLTTAKRESVIEHKSIGDLFVLYEYLDDTHVRKCVCQCHCGNIVILRRRYLVDAAKAYKFLSCGCRRQEFCRALGKAKVTHGKTDTRLYHIWHNMKLRCYDKNQINYTNYGGRGITICELWRNSFEAFYAWAMSNGYKDELSIDRINNDGNYEPANCRWVTHKEQRLNSRPRLCKFTNDRTPLRKLAEDKGYPIRSIYKRLNRGMTLEETFAYIPKKRQ